MSFSIPTIGKENMPLDAQPTNINTSKNVLHPSRSDRATILPPDHDYLASSIKTISRSATSPKKIKPSDIIEAYRGFSKRLRDEIEDVLDTQSRHRVFKLLHDNSASFYAAINRDLKTFLEEPERKPDTNPSDLRRTLYDHLSLPLAAAIALSNIFQFPSLQDQFRKNHLDSLLKFVMEVLQSDKLPEPGFARTWEALLFILGSQRLPVKMLTPRTSQMVNCLQKGMSSEIGHETVRIQSLKTLSQLVQNHPLEAIAPVSRILDRVFPLLMDTSLPLRQQTGRTLSSLALMKIDNKRGALPSHNIHNIAKLISSFINTFSAPGGGKQGKVEYALRLDHWNQSTVPFWTIPVISALILLSDHSTLVVSAQVFGGLLGSVFTNNLTNRLYLPMWHCLVWAYSRVLVKQGTSSQADQTQDMTDKSFLFVSQQLEGGVGEAVMSVILRNGCVGNQPTARSMCTALGLLKRMVGDKDLGVHEDGVALLSTLVASVGASANGVHNHFPVAEEYVNRGLFDEAFFEASNDTITSLLDGLNLPFRSALVWQLDDQGIQDNWNNLMDLWCVGAAAHLRLGCPSSADKLLQVWQSLLLSQVELTQQREHLTTTSACLASISTALVHVLSIPELKQRDVQVAALHFVRRLWKALQTTFVTQGYLDSTAAKLLAALGSATCDLDDEAIAYQFIKLGLLVIPVVDPRPFNALRPLEKAFRKSLAVTRELWPVLAETCKNGFNAHLRDAIAFLHVSYQRWSLSPEELNLWRHFVGEALARSQDPSSLVQSVFNCSDLLNSTQCLALFTSGYAIDLISLPTTMLGTLDKALVALSSSPSPQDILPVVLPFIDYVGKELCKPASFLRLMKALEEGILAWIYNTDDVLSEEEHIGVVDKLFSEPIECQAGHVPSMSFLRQAGRYCEIIGKGMPTMAPAHAFERFWNKTYRGVVFLEKYPTTIVFCLGIIRDLGINGETMETQMTAETVIPDSCPPATPGSHPLRVRQRYFSTSPRLQEQRIPSSTGHCASKGPRLFSIGLPTQPSYNSLKRASSSQDEDRWALKKRKCSPTPSTSPCQLPKKLVFDGVIIPRRSSVLQYSQLITPCPTDASLQLDDMGQNLSQKLDADEKEEESQRIEEEEDVMMEQSQVVDEDEEDLPEVSFVCPSPPHHIQDRSYTEPVLAPPIPIIPSSLQQSMPSSGEPKVLDALRQVASTFRDHKLSKEELMEAQTLVQDLTNQIFQQIILSSI